MREKNFDINNLRVASPCSVGWETMSGDERTRHCQLCNLSVYNISALTDRQARDLVTTKQGPICVRFYRRSDGTVLTVDCPVGIRALRKRAARFATATFATVLGLFSISYGQKEAENVVDSGKSVTIRTPIPGELSRLSGIVTDANGAVIPGITVRITSNGVERTVVTDNTGRFIFDEIIRGIYKLSTKSKNRGFAAYQLKELIVNDFERLEMNIELKVDPNIEIVGELISIDEIPQNLEIDSALKTVQNAIIPRKIIPIPHKRYPN
jgi:hypothetical protein